MLNWQILCKFENCRFLTKYNGKHSVAHGSTSFLLVEFQKSASKPIITPLSRPQICLFHVKHCFSIKLTFSLVLPASNPCFSMHSLLSHDFLLACSVFSLILWIIFFILCVFALFCPVFPLFLLCFLFYVLDFRSILDKISVFSSKCVVSRETFCFSKKFRF